MEREYKPQVADTNALFARRLKRYMRENQLSIEKFAEVIDADVRHLYKWLNGSMMPNTTSMLKICRGTGMSADYLIGLSDEPRRKEGNEDEHTGD